MLSQHVHIKNNNLLLRDSAGRGGQCSSFFHNGMIEICKYLACHLQNTLHPFLESKSLLMTSRLSCPSKDEAVSFFYTVWVTWSVSFREQFC